MKISVQWLREWVDPPVDTAGLAAQLTSVGLEIEAIESVPDSRDGDQTLEVNITPNRGDCLSLAGLAREVAVVNRLPVCKPALDPVMATNSDTFPVEVLAPADCPRYVGRVIRGVDRTCPTPLWMQERLIRSGLRSLGPLIDVTNYVMLELGQPMHAFDLNNLTDGLVVRRAAPGETITLLDGTNLSLDAETLVIADHRAPLALAGIMGGLGSGIREDTTDLFLESAFFTPAAIIGRPRRYHLQTDSSHRFERGVAPDQQRAAMERATCLLSSIVGGEIGPIIEIVSPEYLPPCSLIRLRVNRIRQLLGVSIPVEAVEDILTRLGMTVLPIHEGWQVTPPTARFDLRQEADLIEEVARIWGYDKIPHTRPTAAIVMNPRPEKNLDRAQAARFLVARDYQEIITYSFVDPVLQSWLDPEHSPLALANPLSAELGVMRTTLWPGLVQAARHNLRRQQERIRLFEIGRTFVPSRTGLRQAVQMAGLALGSVYPEKWDSPRRPVDFFDLKNDLEALLADQLGRSVVVHCAPRVHPALHPGQSAILLRGDQSVGWIGALHPHLKTRLDLGTATVVVFELDLEALGVGTVAKCQPLSKFPAIRRDLAIWVDQKVPVEALLQCVRAAAGPLLQELIPFDRYNGKGLDQQRKSIAMGLIVQDATRTLQDADVDAVVASVVQRLASELGATLRD